MYPQTIIPAGMVLGLSLSMTAQAVDSNAVIVTATRTAQTADQTLAPVTVITRDDIERLQATSVPEILRATPGVDITNSGGRGKATSLYLRGTASDHVLVLVDGVKMGSATTGAAALEGLSIHEIERIEIVRGPRSSLYGSEAIGGVIQIFTRKGGDEVKPHAYFSAGSYSTKDYGAGISGSGDRAWYNLNASTLQTDGFDACTPDCFGHDTDRDGYENVSASLRAGYRFANNVEAEINWLRSEGEVKYDGSFQNETDNTQQIMGAKLSAMPTAQWHTRLQLGRAQDESQNFLNGTAQGRFDTERDSLSWQNDVTLGMMHLLTLGVDHQQEAVDSNTAYAVSERDNTALFTQYQGGLGDHDLQLSLRRDDNEQFGEHTTGAAAWGYDLTQTLRLTASFGTAFKAPSFNELYFPGFGDPTLQPEESESIEIGLEHHGRRSHWALHAYETKIDELIAYNAAILGPDNIDSARIRGLEASAGTQLAAWQLGASATLLDPEIRTAGANQGNVLPRRARRSLRLEADRAIGAHSLGATVVAADHRFDDLANSQRLPGYAVVELRGKFQLAPAWSAQLRVENLLDRDYQTAKGYNQPGRSAYLSLHYRP